MKFIRMAYLMHMGKDAPRPVVGYAFETPGWPAWHACVRWGNRYGDKIRPQWVIDHYETGLALSRCGHLKRKQDAPEAMRKVLEEVGREAVLKCLKEHGCA